MKKHKAIIIDVIPLETSKKEALTRLEELESLVKTYGGVVVVKTVQKKGIPDYDTYIGKGKVRELFEIAKEKGADLLIVNNILKSRQIFELKERMRKLGGDITKNIGEGDIDAWDRVDLILKIFSKHAQSTRAKLQIELAGIKHMGPRIFGMGIELSRQAGAMGLRAGQGESNIEIMKRHLQRQELSIVEKLKHYETIDAGHRRRRRRQNFKTAALVGYTNAGKSSILNSLTGKGAYVADELFATLDTRVGKLFIPCCHSHEECHSHERGNPPTTYTPGREILISDTIGFIRDLPPSLIEAFKSTLAETINSDVILHVIDITDPEIHKKIRMVEEILDQLGLKDKPKIYIFNKIDKVQLKKIAKKYQKCPIRPKGILKAGKETSKILGWHEEDDKSKPKISEHSLKLKYKQFTPVFVSAHTKENFKDLIAAISSKC